MSFRPPRSSTPPITRKAVDSLIQSTLSGDISRSSAISVPELSNLTPADVDVLDAIIKRAGPGASTFLTVWKAYTDVLQERHIDTHEVVYYNKLLKLGTLRGANWKEKWDAVQEKHGYFGSTNHAQVDHSEYVSDSEPKSFQEAPAPRGRSPFDSDITTNTLGLEFSENPWRPRQSSPRLRPWPLEPSEPTTDLPPYRANSQRLGALIKEKPTNKPSVQSSSLNEEDAWKKIKISGDEKAADKFRQDRLVERCWDVWRQGYEWIITTHAQISEARDILILRLHIQHWHHKTLAKRELYNRVAILSDKRLLRSHFKLWHLRLKERQQSAWRHSMRQKMDIVRKRRQDRLLNDAWAKWRQSHRSHLAEQRFYEQLVIRFYKRWKQRLYAVDDLAVQADSMLRERDWKAAEGMFNHWYMAVHLRSLERTVETKVSLRVMDEAMTVWKRQMVDMRTAEAYRRVALLKTTIRSWHAARDRLRTLETRAVKHITRQDDFLLRAVMRVWRAHERGKLLERVRTLRLLKSAWAAWTDRIHDHREREDLAIAFSYRGDSSTIVTALKAWRDVLSTHQNAHSFALVHYHSRLNYRMLRRWQDQFISHLKKMRKARKAEQFLRLRRAWTTIKARLNERRRERLLAQFEARSLAKVFQVWSLRARQQRQRKLAEMISYERLTKGALSHWTNRVIAIKVRELDLKHQYNSLIMMKAFNQWKRVRARHIEELNLMASYQDVKREEMVRRMFHQWLSAARSRRRRKLALQEKEEQIRLAVLEFAWDKWRERFTEEKLRPLEFEFILQSHRNALFNAFGMWHSKTKSLPAIRFHAANLRVKFWATWRASMPAALQAKKAREIDKRSILSRYLAKWVQVHRTKIALKTVARARYLRLPTAHLTPRPLVTQPKTAPWPTTAFPRRVIRDEDEESEAGPSRHNHKPRSETSLPPRSRLSKPRETSPARSMPSEANLPLRSRLSAAKVRDPSPVRSTKSLVDDWYTKGAARSETGEEGRSRLWHEFRNMQNKSRASSRSREPP
ncbi:hypothetical protein C8J56DRAFT_955676 [Mycena floridula]|nr:hypothetical protein C8J56DRAFT_955676 [Mycena floridula]